MQLFFSPFACSLASRIAIEEANLDADFIQVKPGAPLPDGSDYKTVSPMGYVPALRTADGRTLTENPAILQYLADLAPDAGLAPEPFSDERYALQRWLSFIGSELHRAVFSVAFAKDAPEEAKQWARALAPKRFELLSQHLDGRETLLDQFTVADAYLLAVLNWCEHAGVDLTPWPVLIGWRARMRERPSVARAMAKEMPLLQAA